MLGWIKRGKGETEYQKNISILPISAFWSAELCEQPSASMTGIRYCCYVFPCRTRSPNHKWSKGWTAIALLRDLTCWESTAKEQSAFRSCAVLSHCLRAMDEAKNHDSWNAFKSSLSPKPRVVFLRHMLIGSGELQLTTPFTKKKKVILSQPIAEQQILKYEDIELGSRSSS